jgi:hypothetical protein
MVTFNSPPIVQKGWIVRRSSMQDDERLQKLETKMLNVVASQATQIVELEMKTQELRDKLEMVRTITPQH